MTRKEDLTVFREVSGGVRHLRKNSYSPLEQSFRNLKKRAVGKNGQPPLWVRVASFGCNLSGTAEACAFVSK